MIEFWDIELEDELDLEVDDFIEGLYKLGFKRKNKEIFVKDIINHNGDKIDDGLFYHLNEQTLIYYPEPNSNRLVFRLPNPLIDENLSRKYQDPGDQIVD